MTTLSLFSLLLGGGLLLLSHRMVCDARAHDSIVGALSPLSVTRAACACLVAFGGVGIILALVLPDADSLVSRLAAAAGLAAAVFALVLTPRPVVTRQSVPNLAQGDTADDDEGIVGMTGTFVASPSARALGRVVIRRGERTVAFAARPMVGVAGPERWDSVVIVDVYHGTALVAPVEREGPRA
jgi:uncharacterized membrane protein YeiB